MNPNPFSALLYSRKFWLAVLDLVLGVVTYFVSKYAPDVADDVKFVFASVQPVLLIVIAAIAYEDAANVQAAGYMHEAELMYGKADNPAQPDA